MDTLILEKQARVLRIALYRELELQMGLGKSERKTRLIRAHSHAVSRFYRRQCKCFNYYPDGFASPSRQSSGVVGEGASL